MNLRTSLVFVFLAGCSTFNADNAPGSGPSNDDGGTAGNGQSPVPGTPALGFSVVPAGDRAFVIQGQSLEIPIRITRKESTTDAVAIAVGGLPAGATVAPLQIPAGSNEGKLKVTVAATTPQGSVDLSISASTGDGSTAKGAVPIFVRGAPGSVDTTFAPAGLFLSETDDATLTLLPDGSMVAAAKVGAGARIVKVDPEGKSLASTDAAVGAFVAPLPDGRYLNFGNAKLARLSAKLERDTSFNGGTGVVTTNEVVADVAVAGGKAYALSRGSKTSPDGTTNPAGVVVKRFSADGVLESATCTISSDISAQIELGRHGLDVDTTGQVRVVGSLYQDENYCIQFFFGCGPSGALNVGGNMNPSTPASRYILSNQAFPALVSDSAGGFFVAVGKNLLEPSRGPENRMAHVDATGKADRLPFVTDLKAPKPILARDSAGSLILAGSSDAYPQTVVALRRYTRDGTEDAAFVHAENAATSANYPYGLVVQRDGRIVVLASSTGQLGLVRYWG